MRLGIVVAVALVLASAGLWQLVPAVVATDGTVESLVLQAMQRHRQVLRWDATLVLPVGGFAYDVASSLPVRVASHAEGPVDPLDLAFEIRVDGERVLREAVSLPAPGIRHVEWPAAQFPLHAGGNVVTFELTVECAGASGARGWWAIDAGPARVEAQPR